MREKVLILVYVTMREKEAIKLRMRGHGGVRGIMGWGGDRVLGKGWREENDIILL